MKRLLLRPFYLLLKKDMVKRLSEKHGESFIDDVMETFGISTNLMQSYYKTAENLGVQEGVENIFPIGLGQYTIHETGMQTYGDKPVSDIRCTNYKIIVPTEADRQELMVALQHIHYSNVDTNHVAVNQLVHEYLDSERTGDEETKDSIIVDPEFFEKASSKQQPKKPAENVRLMPTVPPDRREPLIEVSLQDKRPVPPFLPSKRRWISWVSLQDKRPVPPLSPRIQEGVLGTCPRCGSSEVKTYNHLFGPSIGCIHPDCQNYHKRFKNNTTCKQRN